MKEGRWNPEAEAAFGDEEKKERRKRRWNTKRGVAISIAAVNCDRLPSSFLALFVFVYRFLLLTRLESIRIQDMYTCDTNRIWSLQIVAHTTHLGTFFHFQLLKYLVWHHVFICPLMGSK